MNDCEEAIQYAKEWFNFHEDDEFDSVQAVKKAAKKVFDIYLYGHACRRLDEVLCEDFRPVYLDKY